jgi:hypothetical protein
LSAKEFTIPSEPLIEGLSSALGYVVKQYQLAGLVGEERNIAQVFLTCETRHLPAKYRRHVIPQGETGAGKTTLARAVLKPFWSDVESYTRMTGAGLDRKDESLDGKILFLEQLGVGEPTQLRFLMTEGELTILYAERDQSGRIASKIHHIKGTPVFITTLVGAEIDPQLLSRVSTLEVDQSSEQTKRIINRKLEGWSTNSTEEEWKTLAPISWVDEKCKQLGPYVEAIKIPFAKQLSNGMPPLLSMRRGTDRILNLVAAIAFLKAALGLRPLVEMKVPPGVRQVHIIALPEDLNDALYCLGDALTESVSYFFGRSKELYDFLSKKNDRATTKDVALALKMSQNRAREYLNILVQLGHATKSKEKGTYYYEATSHEVPHLELKAAFTYTDLEAWFASNFAPGSAELVISPESRTGFTDSSSVVMVEPQTELKSSTIEGTVPEPSTIGQIVPDLSPDADTTITADNETVPSNLAKTLGLDQVMEKLHALRSAPTRNHYIDYAATILKDQGKAKTLIDQLEHDGQLINDPDGKFRWTR